MTKRDRFTYGVKKGEKITLTADLQNLPGNAIGVGLPMTREPGQGKPTFSFVVPTTLTDKVYIVVAEVNFVMPQTGAQAALTLEGDQGGGPFNVMTIKASSPIKDPGFSFWVED